MKRKADFLEENGGALEWVMSGAGRDVPLAELGYHRQKTKVIITWSISHKILN